MRSKHDEVKKLPLFGMKTLHVLLSKDPHPYPYSPVASTVTVTFSFASARLIWHGRMKT